MRGRWLLVDFIYTRCISICSTQGSAFARLQDRLSGPLSRDEVTLLSISFDPAHDDPVQLAAYQRRSGDRGRSWVAARPTDARDLVALARVFGIDAIPDGMGGFMHDPVIEVIDPRGRLVAVLDWTETRAAARYVTGRPGS